MFIMFMDTISPTCMQEACIYYSAEDHITYLAICIWGVYRMNLIIVYRLGLDQIC